MEKEKEEKEKEEDEKNKKEAKKKKKEKEKKKKDEDEKKKKEEARKDDEVIRETQDTTLNIFSPIAKIEFESLAKKTQEKTKKVKSRLLKLKVKAQRVKALVEEKEEAKTKGREELLSKVEKVVHSAKKDKGKEKTHEEHYEKF